MCALLTGVQTCALPILLGLTRQGFEVSANTTKAVALVRPDGSACVGFSDGAVVMRLTTEVLVASELAADSCLYGQVLNHEERHANVGRRLFTEFEIGSAHVLTPVTNAHLVFRLLLEKKKKINHNRHSIINTYIIKHTPET